MTDATPTPPVAPPADGLAQRNVPWQGGLGQIQIQPVDGSDGQKAFAVIVDTPSVRAVTIWDAASLESLADSMYQQLGKAPRSLVIADPSALRGLGPVG